MARPPIQHHKVWHEFVIDEDALDGLQKVAGIHAAGQAAKGILSNPGVAPLLVGALLSAVVAVKGKDIIDSLTRWYKGIQSLLDADTPEAKSQAASDLSNALRELIEFFSPLGPLTPIP